jgi:hypothetical protein
MLVLNDYNLMETMLLQVHQSALLTSCVFSFNTGPVSWFFAVFFIEKYMKCIVTYTFR